MNCLNYNVYNNNVIIVDKNVNYIIVTTNKIMENIANKHLNDIVINFVNDVIVKEQLIVVLTNFDKIAKD